jgi:dTDP-glucose pyrophosphorylase/CBS domain-containing protein
LVDGREIMNMPSDKSRAWRKALLPASASIEEAIQNLNETTLQIVVVVSPDGVLEGTVTDGDIRRGLLKGLNLQSSIEKVMNRESFVVPSEMTRDTVLSLMRSNRLHQLPVIDESRRVIGLHIWNDLEQPAERSNLMVIMAGGFGSRLRPHTENCPKPLLPVAGKPMLEHIIESARNEGFMQFVISIHYLGHMIEEHLGNGSRLGVSIDYLREKEPLGTAGALSLLVPRPERSLVVTNGDVLTDINYGDLLDFHTQHGAAATMAVRLHETQHPYGVVHLKGVNIVGFEEKPVAQSHVNAGIYALNPNVLDLLSPSQHCDMPTLFERLREQEKVILAYPMHEPWLDIGGRNEFKEAQSMGKK